MTDIRLKYLIQLNPKVSMTGFSEEDEVSFAPMECVKQGIMQPYTKTVGELNSSYTCFEDGDLLIAKVTPCFENGNIAIAEKLSNGVGFGSSELFVIRALCNTKLLFYILQSNQFKNAAMQSMTGTAGLKRVSSDAIRNYRVKQFDDENASLIVGFLDRKTRIIDSMISDKERLIQLLEEQRTSVIYSAVTKGIDSTAKMKDSGVEWLGEIPAHWQILTNHQLFAERNIKCEKPDAVLLSVTKYLGVILQSQAEELNLATVAPAETTEGYKVVCKGDLVMNIMRAKDGSYGISNYDGVISPAYCIYYTRQQANPKYLYYLFKTPMYMEIFKNYSTGIAEHRMRLYPVNFFKIPAVVPPLEEQNEIVAYLDKRVKDIDELISLTQQQIEKLKEYRQSVISEVVTGKVAVV